MALTPEDVRWVAELARLELGAGEVEEMARQLSGILAHVEQLDTEGLAASGGSDPTDVGRPGGAPLRPDEPGPDPLLAAPETLAPGWQDGFFTVPRLASHEEPGGGAGSRSGPGAEPGSGDER